MSGSNLTLRDHRLYYVSYMTVTLPVQTKLTYDDYLTFPDDGQIHEIIDGVHYVSPSPFTRHQNVSRHIQFQLYEQLERTGLAYVFDAPTDVHLTEHDIVVPDLALIDRRRGDIISERKINGPPDLVVEVLSKSTAKRDRSDKHRLYETTGVGEYWIVDPQADSVMVFQLAPNGVYRASGPVSETIEFHSGRLHAVVDLTVAWRGWPEAE